MYHWQATVWSLELNCHLFCKMSKEDIVFKRSELAFPLELLGFGAVWGVVVRFLATVSASLSSAPNQGEMFLCMLAALLWPFIGIVMIAFINVREAFLEPTTRFS